VSGVIWPESKLKEAAARDVGEDVDIVDPVNPVNTPRFELVLLVPRVVGVRRTEGEDLP
jgi:hypothetical protein